MTLTCKYSSAIAALTALKMRAIEAESCGRSGAKWQEAFADLEAAVKAALTEIREDVRPFTGARH